MVKRVKESVEYARERAGGGGRAMRDDAEVGAEQRSDDLEEVHRRLAEIQARKRGRVRWGVGQHTAELALEALGINRKIASKKHGKQRRRKRNKRLL